MRNRTRAASSMIVKRFVLLLPRVSRLYHSCCWLRKGKIERGAETDEMRRDHGEMMVQ